MAEQLHRFGELTLTDELRGKLETVSVSTIKRLVRYPEHRLEKMAFRKYPSRPKNQHYANIPVRKIAWDLHTPGHFEVDTVHHCGNASNGFYFYTLQLVDVATGWSEITAIYGNSYAAMKDGFDFLLARLPFPVLEFHPDNGPEFVNQLLIKYWQDRVHNVSLSRSKPYRKNDNRFVEENNHSLVRAYIGHSRLDSIAQLKALRYLEDLLWLYHNCFLPCMRLEDKLLSSAGKLVKIYDHPLPPLDRLLASDLQDKSKLIELANYRKTINPLFLRQKIDQAIAQLLALPCIASNEKVDFRSTKLNLNKPSVTLSFDLTRELIRPL